MSNSSSHSLHPHNISDDDDDVTAGFSYPNTIVPDSLDPTDFGSEVPDSLVDGDGSVDGCAACVNDDDVVDFDEARVNDDGGSVDIDDKKDGSGVIPVDDVELRLQSPSFLKFQAYCFKFCEREAEKSRVNSLAHLASGKRGGPEPGSQSYINMKRYEERFLAKRKKKNEKYE